MEDLKYNVGDGVNGHVLGEDNEWHPIDDGIEPAIDAPSKKNIPTALKWGAPFVAVLALAGVIGAVVANSGETSVVSDSTQKGGAAIESDRDGDGVPDSRDGEPNDPSWTGSAPRPPADTDGDGVPDIYDGAPNDASWTDAAPKPTTYEVGDTFMVDSFRVTLLEAKPLGGTVGSTEMLDSGLSTAQGSYYGITVHVENTGKTPEYWYGAAVLVSSDERMFQQDNDASSDYFFNDANGHYDEDAYVSGDLNPGASNLDDIVFDLPAGTTPFAIVFNASSDNPVIVLL